MLSEPLAPLQAALSGVQLCVHTAGPFQQTSHPVLEEAISARVGEQLYGLHATPSPVLRCSWHKVLHSVAATAAYIDVSDDLAVSIGQGTLHSVVH